MWATAPGGFTQSDDFFVKQPFDTHTHTHTGFSLKRSTTPNPFSPSPLWLGLPIKSKVVCFYWCFALTSGLSSWRLYLSVSDWKSSVDNAQCFQLGENQTPGVLGSFHPPPRPFLKPPHPLAPPSFGTRPTGFCHFTLSFLLLHNFPLRFFKVGISPRQITDTKRGWRTGRSRAWVLAVPEPPVSFNEPIKVYFPAECAKVFLVWQLTGKCECYPYKRFSGSHYFLSNLAPDGF